MAAILNKTSKIHFLFKNIFIAFLDTANVGLAIKFRSLRQLQAEK